jgi:hypothetical protein
VSDDRLARCVVDIDEAFVVVNRNAAGLRLLDNGAVERGAGNHRGRLAIADRIAAAEAGEQLAMLIFKGPLMAGDADIAHLFHYARGGKNVHAIGSKAETAACFVWPSRRFKDLSVESGATKKESEDGACDAAADDESAFGRDWHKLPHLVIILIIKIMIL